MDRREEQIVTQINHPNDSHSQSKIQFPVDRCVPLQEDLSNLVQASDFKSETKHMVITLACNIQDGAAGRVLDLLFKGIITHRKPTQVKIVEHGEIGALKDLISGASANFREWIDSKDTSNHPIQSSTDLNTLSDQIFSYVSKRRKYNIQQNTAYLSTVVLFFDNPVSKKSTHLILLPSWPDPIPMESIPVKQMYEQYQKVISAFESTMEALSKDGWKADAF